MFPSVLRGNWISSEKGTLAFTIILQITNVCSQVYSQVTGSALRKEHWIYFSISVYQCVFPSGLLGNWVSSEEGTLEFTVLFQIVNLCSPISDCQFVFPSVLEANGSALLNEP